jgi:hypothetical protein
VHEHSKSKVIFIRAAAAQMWLLGRILPIVVGDVVPMIEEDPKWANFRLLMKIVDILFAPSTNTELLAFLVRLIEGHHLEFKRLYPSASVIPKMHFMVHMPRLMHK